MPASQPDDEMLMIARQTPRVRLAASYRTSPGVEKELRIPVSRKIASRLLPRVMTMIKAAGNSMRAACHRRILPKNSATVGFCTLTPIDPHPSTPTSIGRAPSACACRISTSRNSAEKRQRRSRERLRCGARRRRQRLARHDEGARRYRRPRLRHRRSQRRRRGAPEAEVPRRAYGPALCELRRAAVAGCRTRQSRKLEETDKSGVTSLVAVSGTKICHKNVD